MFHIYIPERKYCGSIKALCRILAIQLTSDSYNCIRSAFIEAACSKMSERKIKQTRDNNLAGYSDSLRLG